MLRKRYYFLVALAALAAIPAANAGGGAGTRTILGGHPYHNGNYFVPPSSAYEAARVFPPARYGFPSYYMQSSHYAAWGAGQYGYRPAYGNQVSYGYQPMYGNYYYPTPLYAPLGR